MQPFDAIYLVVVTIIGSILYFKTQKDMVEARQKHGSRNVTRKYISELKA